jgi:multidrug efflux pump subunit AcrA (membrane-fusion protein)
MLNHFYLKRLAIKNAYLLVFTILAVFLTAAAHAAISKKPVVFVLEAKPSELSDLLTYPARVEPKIKAAVIAEADGVVSRIHTPLGTRVATNSPLLVIRNTDPVYQYAPMVVQSPVSGVVSRVDVTEGSRVSRGDKLLLVTDPENARVVVEVTAQDLASFRPGLEGHLALPNQTGGSIKIRVKGLSPFVDPATGTASCELELVKEKGGANRLPPPGVIGRATFRVNIHNGFSLPDSALTFRGKDPYVRVVNGTKAKLVPVTLGRKQAGFVEIVKGLSQGDRVIERASGFVADGEEVEIKSASTDEKQG